MKADLLREKTLDTICAHALLHKGDRVLVALSGGADSVALLHVLLSLKSKLGLTEIEAAHVHHGLRGEEADRDADFVKNLCADWDVSLHTTRVDVASLATARHMGVEEVGREVRYAFFEEVANGAVIATAHTATDNVETVLMHMTRGCGLQGVCGIAPKRGRVIRPLLACSRIQVEQYCCAHALPFVTDSTNTDVRYARNRIRAQVLPPLRELNPSFEEAIAHLTESCIQDAQYLDAQASQAVDSLSQDRYGRYNTVELNLLAPALRSRVWQQLLSPLGRALTFDEILRLNALLDRCGVLTLSPSCRVVTHRDTTEIDFTASSACEETDEALEPEKTYLFFNKRYFYHIISMKEMEKLKFVHKNVLYYAFDYDTIGHNPRLTYRQDGDFLHPAHRGCSKTLKKLFNELRVPLSVRMQTPVLRDENGVFLIPGITCDERVHITENTRTVALFLPEGFIEERNGKDE